MIIHLILVHDHTLAHEVHVPILVVHLLVEVLVVLVSLEVWRILFVVVDHLVLKLVIGTGHETLEWIAFAHLVVPINGLAILIILQGVIVLLFLSIDDLLIKFINLIPNNMSSIWFCFNIILIKTIRKVLILLWNFIFIIIVNRSNVLLYVGLMSFIILVLLNLISYLFIVVLLVIIDIFKVFVVIGLLEL